MLHLSNKLSLIPVLSLRTGGPVATAMAPIINPNNLKIEGFYCQDNRSNQQLILVAQDIREVLPQGFVVNDYEVLAHPNELIRLESILKIDFQLLNKTIKTISGQRIGKVNDYATDLDSLYVHKLYVAQSIVKSLTGGALVVDRTQIHEITRNHIIIEDLLKPTASRAAVSL